jgi:hypothetical protein
VIDWNRRGPALAELLLEYSRTRDYTLRRRLFRLAKELVALRKIELKAKALFLEWIHIRDREKAADIYEEYLKLVREINNYDG